MSYSLNIKELRDIIEKEKKSVEKIENVPNGTPRGVDPKARGLDPQS